MITVLTIITFALSLLFIMLSLSTQKFLGFKKLLKWYSLLFTICFFALFTIIAQQHRNTWWPIVASWTSQEGNPNHVFADQLQAPDLEPIVPLIEQFQLKDHVQLNAPLVAQYPELPRGCEVTSLSMLLQYHKVDADKLTLAEQVTKDPTPYQYKENKIHFGDPNQGFVGDMYQLSNPGYGVYHEPIAQLTKKYVNPNRVLDLSGDSFYSILSHLNEGEPVWVITNTRYQRLPDAYFQMWHTPNGPIKVTMKEHSVLITGYDSKFIYFNDPLTGNQKKADLANFRESWVQMGKQAITITKP